MFKPTIFEGTCACKAIRIIASEPDPSLPVPEPVQMFNKRDEAGGWKVMTGACGCHSCTKSTGAVLAANLFWPKGTITFEDPTDKLREYSTSPGKIRKRCSQCGTTISSELDQGKTTVPLACFLRDDDKGATNVRISSILLPSAYWACDEASTLRFEARPGGLAALLQEDGVFKADISQGAPKPFDFSKAYGMGASVEKASFACHCGGVRFEAPPSTRLSHCCCLTCCLTSGSLAWSALFCHPKDMQIVEGSKLTKYGSRSFCSDCGAFGFWQNKDDSIAYSLALLTDYSLFHQTNEPAHWICLRDLKGLRLPHGDGLSGPEYGWAGTADDGQPKYLGDSSGERIL